VYLYFLFSNNLKMPGTKIVSDLVKGHMDATLNNIGARGDLDRILSGDQSPTKLSFWISKCKPVAGFAFERSFATASNGDAKFSGSQKWNYERSADAARLAVGRCVLPGIGITGLGVTTNGAAVGEIANGAAYEPAWANAVGFRLFPKISFKFSNIEIQSLTHDANQLALDLSVPTGRRLGELVGQYLTLGSRQARSRQSQVVYVPFNFWYTKNTSTPLRLVSAAFHGAQVSASIAPLANLVFRPNSEAIASVKKRADYTALTVLTDLTAAAKGSNTELSATLSTDALTMHLYTEYVYLTMDQRKDWSSKAMVDVIEQHQTLEFDVTGDATGSNYSTDKKVSCEIDIASSMKEFYFFARNTTDETDGTAGEFVGTLNPITGLMEDPILRAEVLSGGKSTVLADGLFYRLMQSYQYHTCYPRGFAYVFSADCLDPEALCYTGGINSGMLSKLVLNVWINGRSMLSTSNAMKVYIVVVSYNILVSHGGLAYLSFH
jgi:hypothetical protein